MFLVPFVAAQLWLALFPVSLILLPPAPPFFMAKEVNLAKVKHFIMQAAAALVESLCQAFVADRDKAKQLFPYIFAFLPPKAAFFF